METHLNLTQNSPEWHAFRLKGIGASEIAAVLGVCPYGTPHSVWLVKTGRSKGFEGNSFTQHGQDTEAKARARYELTTMEDVPPACAIHPVYEICRASLDGLRADNKLILELKCPKGRDTIDQAKAGKVPDHYIYQVQYQLAVTGADMCHFFVYHEESGEDALVEVLPDLEMQGKLFSAALDFWQKYVIPDVPPPLTDRDVKVIDDNEQIKAICKVITDGRESLSKKELDTYKLAAVKLAGHPKMKCGNVQISTVLRNGKFSFHKLTIKEEVTA